MPNLESIRRITLPHWIRQTTVLAICAWSAVLAYGRSIDVGNLDTLQLPLETSATNLRNRVAVERVPAEPPSTQQNDVTANVFDTEFRDKGHLFVNGPGPLTLFDPGDTRTFVHYSTIAYRVKGTNVSFVGDTVSGTNSTAPEPTDGPLRVRGSIFVNQSGQPVFLAGAIVCCEGAKQLGWPLITNAALQHIADNGGNYTHIRLGPFRNNEGTEFVAYRPAANGKQDLNFWNPDFWTRVRTTIEKARSVGIYIEVDLIDAWILERPALTPWSKNNNVNGVDDALCANLSRAPNPLYERWLRKVVAETGEYDNVIYQIGNETFDCKRKGSSIAYEIGVANIVRDELKQRGFGSRLIGTNSHNDSIENHPLIDYVSVHGEAAPRRRLKPTMNNEQRSSWVSVSNFETELRRAYQKGTYFQLWRGGLDDNQYRGALQKLSAFRQRIGQR